MARPSKPAAKRKRKLEMSSENIQLVKPPVNSSKDKKLAGVGVVLVIVGLLGAAQFPAMASRGVGADISGSGATLTWSGGAVQYEATQTLAPDGNELNICESTVTSCTTFRGPGFVAGLLPRAGATSFTVFSYLMGRVDPQDFNKYSELGPGTYKVQMMLHTRDANDPAASTKEPIGPLLEIIVPLTSRPSGNQNNNQNQSPSVQSSRPSPPPVQIEFSGVASASQLLAGNRNFTFEGDDVSDVVAVRVNGKSLPIFNREEDSFDVKLPKLGPGSYSVIIYTATDNWEIPGAIVIGELLPEIRKEAIEETFERSSSELPASAKREIRDMIEATPNLRKITVTAIAVREIVRPDGNKLARARAEAAMDFIERIEPGVIIETKLVYSGDTDIPARGLVFRVAQKKS